MGQDTPLAGLPEPGEPVFYPKVGHCIYRGVTEDRVAPGTQLLELEDLEEGSRILIPLARVPQLNLRPAGTAFQEIQEVLGAEFEEPLEDDDERHKLVETLITDGSPRALAQSLKRLHLLRQTTGLSREDELTRKKIRSWLAAEVSISKECTRAEAQAFMTRILQESMAQHEKREKEEAKQRRRAARELKKAEEAEAEARAERAASVGGGFGSPIAAERADFVADAAPETDQAPSSPSSESSSGAEKPAPPEPAAATAPEEPTASDESTKTAEVASPDETETPNTTDDSDKTDAAPASSELRPRPAEEETPLG